MYKKVSLNLTQGQVSKLLQGKPIQLTAAQLKGNKHFLMLHPTTVQKVGGAMKKNKGVRIMVSPHELEMSGEGIREFLDKLKNAGKWIKEKVIDTPFYQQNIKPIARQVVDKGVDFLTTKLPLPAAANDAIRSGVNKVGDITGAYGVKRRGRPRKKLVLEDNMSTFLGPNAPAMNPTMPSLPAIGGACCANCGYRGGSFSLR